jgi:hypothetical protein
MPYGIFQEAFALVLDSSNPADDGRAAAGMSVTLLFSLSLLLSAMAMMVLYCTCSMAIANDDV